MTADVRSPNVSPIERVGLRLFGKLAGLTLFAGVLLLVGAISLWPLAIPGIAALALAWRAVRANIAAGKADDPRQRQRLDLRSYLWLAWFWIALLALMTWSGFSMQTSPFPTKSAVEFVGRPARIEIETGPKGPQVWTIKVWPTAQTQKPWTFRCGTTNQSCPNQDDWRFAASQKPLDVRLIAQNERIRGAVVGGRTLVDVKDEEQRYRRGGRTVGLFCGILLAAIGGWSGFAVVRLRRLRLEG